MDFHYNTGTNIIIEYHGKGLQTQMISEILVKIVLNKYDVWIQLK
jgi:hypothetical protein